MTDRIMDLSLATIIIFLALIFLVSSMYPFYQMRALTVYPTILASAERQTDEYMNGYSQRPVNTMFLQYGEDEMLQFIRFLLKYVLIWDFKREGKSITLFFRPSARWKLSLKIPKSYIKIYSDGKTEVYITPEDYDFLKVPISYHLLCQKVAERIKESYELFEQGNEAGALGVFRVEKKGVGKR
ncbi:MAG: hypothetical protein KAU14_06180 [Thermoplasmata archaeon]|nr:hypothetical protein [Thermoplasmata archaeon]